MFSTLRAVKFAYANDPDFLYASAVTNSLGTAMIYAYFGASPGGINKARDLSWGTRGQILKERMFKDRRLPDGASVQVWGWVGACPRLIGG